MKKILSFVVVLAAATMVGCCGNANQKAADGTAACAEKCEAAACAEKCDSTACTEKSDSTACAEECAEKKPCCQADK